VRNEGPFSLEEVEALSAETSPETGKRYGTQRVCRAFDLPRSTFYERRDRMTKTGTLKPQPRGPAPAISDVDLLKAIKADLAASPFKGEGHKKVHARLRVVHGIRVSPKRILRLMRQEKLLSPYRRPKGEPSGHDGTIGTDAPDEMWGTDGTRILTVDDGYVWIFSAVDHFNSECVGWYVCKEGTRFNALQPLAMGLTTHFGSVAAGVARGLTVRVDHGSQYVSEHFKNQLQHWGIGLSYAFVSEPETNGIAERFFRTLKEQAIYGRVFRNLEEVREAVATFVRQYNAFWLVRKRGYLSPLQARQQWVAAQAA
jgi:transposase InsO family protein